MQKPYEVTIEGIGKRPLVNVFRATSPGYAGRLAKDKYGDWITIANVRELPDDQPKHRSNLHQRTEHRRRLQMQQEFVELPTWKGRATAQAKAEKERQLERRAAIAESIDRKRDEATFKQ